MESLVEISAGSDDIVIGISGFGSAKVSLSRWHALARLTGRTTFALTYDAQELPWPKTTRIPFPSLVLEARRRWEIAQRGGLEAANYMAGWLRRWTDAGRRVLVVGFSLGGFIAWKAVQQVQSPLIDLILISAAVGDTRVGWEGVDKIGRLINMYSSDDMALRYLYPYVVAEDSTPAAGIGTLVVRGPNIQNVDLTDLVGRDHLWASENILQLTKLALGCYWGSGPIDKVCAALSRDGPGQLSEEAVQRLYRWFVVDPFLWKMLGRALQGDADAVRQCRGLDEWSLQKRRLGSLLEAGRAVRILLIAGETGKPAAGRSLTHLRGMVRAWLSGSSLLA